MLPMGGGGLHMFMWGQRGDAAKKRPTVAMYRRLLRFVGPYRWNLAFAAALLVISTALGLVWPQIVQRVLDLGFKEPGLLDELVVAPPIGIIGQYLGRKIRDISRAAQDAQGEAVGVLQEALAEVRVVQAFTREEYEAKRFHEKLLVMFQKSIDRSRIGAIMFPAIGFLGFASSIVVLWYGGHQVATGELTAGQLVAFLLYMGMVAGPGGGPASQWTGIHQAFRAADPDL